MSGVHAEVPTIPPVIKDRCVFLPQTCANCTFVNISSITYPNSSISVSNIRMTKNLQNFNYTYCQTDAVGQYIVCTTGDPNGNLESACYDFDVTFSGKKLDTPRAILYIVFTLFSGALFLLFLYPAVKIPFRHKEANDLFGQLNNKRYLKVFFICLTYITGVFLSYLLWNLSIGYLEFEFAGVIFMGIFYVLMASTIPLMFVMVFIYVASLIQQKKLDNLIGRGLNPR